MNYANSRWFFQPMKQVKKKKNLFLVFPNEKFFWVWVIDRSCLFIVLTGRKKSHNNELKQDSTSSYLQASWGSFNNSLITSKVDTSVPSNLKSFSFSELKNATKNFRSETFLGEGGFGCVFKGWLDENTLAPTKPGTGIVVAVKRLKAESFQGHKEWLVCSFRTIISFLPLWPCKTISTYFCSLPCYFAGRSELSGTASSWKSSEAYWILCRIWE